MTAFYNEWERYPAQWIRNLIAAGHVADGIVDERSIVELRATDLAATQCHFFAGIGGWSYALRLAGWPDDRPVWTASCPCQPFSTAGKGRGTDDERHLWPVVFELVRQCRPAILFGEQVASPAGRAWLDAVSADLEGAGYAVGAANLCAAGVGAPHIRQRLYFVAVADADRQRLDGERLQLRERGPLAAGAQAAGGGESGELADADYAGPQGWGERRHGGDEWAVGAGGVDGGVAYADSDGRGPRRPGVENGDRTIESSRRGEASDGRLGDADREPGRRDGRAVLGAESGARRVRLVDRGPRVAGRDAVSAWSDAEWIACTDGKSRPAQPGSFPLAYGVPTRMGACGTVETRSRRGELAGYGNAIVPDVAATWIQAVMDAIDARRAA